MGTLYECLREARLEQFYPAFRANGITRSEALINLSMPEFFALGITSNEDKCRLIELVNIIKSVHSSGFTGTHSPQRQSSGTRQPHSSDVNFANTSHDNNSISGRETYHTRSQHSSKSRRNANREISAPTVQHLEPSRDVIVQDRVSNYSLSTYKDRLRQISESSESDAAVDHSDEEPTATSQIVSRNVLSHLTVRSFASKGSAMERIKHSKRNSYNYGVHKVSTPTKTRASRSGSHRGLGDEKIKVCVRKRPLTRREQRTKEEDIVLIESTNTLIVNESKLAVDLKAYTLQHEFIFDEVFDESCTNEDVYIRATRPLVSCIFNGGTATCFAYGQTGAGKTHTMLGGENVPGLYLLAGQDIFSIIQSGTYGKGLHVWVSFFEIYCGQLFDLLNRRNRLQAREDGSRQVCIAGLTETEATSVSSLVQILEYGNSVRSKGASGVNPDSSRSHAILQLDIRNSEDAKVGKISFIDLAGSERASDVTDTDKQTRIEGAEINQSLLALKECIRSIDQESRHTPFRQSKLTHILKDSFVGNSRTCMIANISPTEIACENTLNTLRYADRVKELKRDSTKSGSVGQAMNLLMNIPPTAPSIFHPSNILSSSTPMRSSSQSHRERTNAHADPFLDPAETPIRGHNLQRRHKESLRNRQGESNTQASVIQSRIEQLNGLSLNSQIPPVISSRSSAHATAASQGSVAPPPDASPSESDQTDTDSCNVTHPVVAMGRTVARQMPVMKSTDTEFDFPTSDFNNIEDFNDLNRSSAFLRRQNVLKHKESHLPGQMPSDDQAAAAAEIIVTPAVSSNARAPVLRPVLYRSTDQDAETTHAGPLSHSSHISGAGHKSQISELVSAHPPGLNKARVKEVDTSDDSIDDEDLLFEGPSIQSALQEMNFLGAPSINAVLKANSMSFINKDLMIPLPGNSGDLTNLMQRSSLRSEEQVNLGGMNELSLKSANSTTFSHPGGASTALEDLTHKVLSSHSEFKSPLRMMASQTSKQLQPQEEKLLYKEADSISYNVEQQQSSSRQLPQPHGHSPSHDHPPTASAFTLQQRTGSPYKSSEDSFQGSNVQSPSDTGYTQKTASSPTAEVSGDSLENIRASLSDQGPNGYQLHQKSKMRKGRSDPMLALDTQRKKHTLPDPQSISKMLTRSNTSKLTRVPRDAGWKVIHNEQPLPYAPEVNSVVGDYLSESGLLITSDIDLQKDDKSELQEQFSDSCYEAAVRGKKRASVTERPTRGKQLPQAPTLKSELGQHSFSGQVQHQDTFLYTTDASAVGLRLAVKSNSAIVTEKLSSGAVFSPIHPPPVTLVEAKSAALGTSSSIIFQPTPITAPYTSDLATSVGAAQGGGQEVMSTASLQAKMQLVAAHEDQLATITSLCKYEMRLLLSAKKVMGRRGFDDYLRRVSDILQQKMTAIASLHEQIFLYRSNHSHNHSAGSSIVASVSDSGTSLASAI